MADSDSAEAPVAEEEAPAPAPEPAPAPAPAEEASPAAPEAPAEPAAPPAEPAQEAAKEPDAGDSATPPADAAAPPTGTPEGAEAPAPPVEEAPASKPSVHESTGSKRTKGESVTESSSVSFDKGKPERMSAIDGRKSSLYPREHRTTKDMNAPRRSSKTRDRYNFSLMSIKRGSFASFQERAKAPKFMNSYKLDSEKPFNAAKVTGILKEILTESITENMTYDPELCAVKAKHVSSVLRNKIKEQDHDRYKLVCLVTIGEKKSYDIFTGLRFLWDSERDRYATFMHENMYLFATAIVVGIYFE